MGWDTRMKHARRFAAFAAAMMLSTASSLVPAGAQEAPAAKSDAKTAAPASPAAAEAAKKQKDAEAAKRAYEAGLKSYQSAKFEPAVQSLSAALRGGGLSSQDMARGLYYRGLAYKKQSKPGLAISDLTSALWLKNGLNDADRQSATAERADAYKLAGLGDGNSGAETVAVADPNGKASAANAVEPAAAAQPQPAQPASAPSAKPTATNESGLPNPFTVNEGAPQPTRSSSKSTAAALDQVAALEQSRVEPTTAAVAPAAAVAVPAPIPSTIPSTTPSQAPAQGAAQGGNGASNSTVAGFFSNLFGGGSEAPAPEQPPVTTASTNQTTSATSSWTDTTSVTAGAKSKATPAAKAAAAAAAAPVAQAAAVPASPARAAAQPAPVPAPQVKGGKYKLHIAALRSRPEAEALAQKLVQQHGNQLAARAPTVDEAVIGSMGTFYRVRVGSYATADEPRGLCNTLRNSGYDCLVVTN